jgi:hypothetical protein
MQFKQTTVVGLFANARVQYIIPLYQRAYSWEEDQWNMFLSDLQEQSKGNNNYFFGNILLETIKKDIKYEIIDGQQRLTTLIIFIRSIIDVLKKRKERNNTTNFDFNFLSTENTYLKNEGNIKLRPVEYDKAFFDSLIIEGKNESLVCTTKSQERMKKCKEYFIKELEKLDTDFLLNIFEKLESTELTCIELDNKKDAALMFELQNNRGKDLTNMEKIKSYFMYQMYVYSNENETLTNIEFISNLFNGIYQFIHDLELEEDNVLIYHCQVFIKGFYYRSLDDIKVAFKEAKDKVEWIKNFVTELHTSFSNLRKMEKSKLPYLEDLRKLSFPAFLYPFIIKGYKYSNNNDEYLNKLYHILEVVAFRYKLINSRADFLSRINKILIDFNGDLDKLKNDFKTILNNEYHWSDERTKGILNGYMYENPVLIYLLLKYEDSLQNKGYSAKGLAIKEVQIEHISPQNPKEETINYCYEVDENGNYSNEFLEKYLNCLGNLMLISNSHNSSIKNKSFSEKLETYKSNPLLRQQAEIIEFVDLNEPKWGKNEIEKRHNKIVEFAINKWNFDNIK